MTAKLLDTFERKITDIHLQPSSGGVHEIWINDELVYSKRATGEHPADDLIIAEVQRRLPSGRAGREPIALT